MIKIVVRYYGVKYEQVMIIHDNSGDICGPEIR